MRAGKIMQRAVRKWPQRAARARKRGGNASRGENHRYSPTELVRGDGMSTRSASAVDLLLKLHERARARAREYPRRTGTSRAIFLRVMVGRRARSKCAGGSLVIFGRTDASARRAALTNEPALISRTELGVRSRG